MLHKKEYDIISASSLMWNFILTPVLPPSIHISETTELP
jgi:hypothetical protein